MTRKIPFPLASHKPLETDQMRSAKNNQCSVGGLTGRGGRKFTLAPLCRNGLHTSCFHAQQGVAPLKRHSAEPRDYW